MRFSRLLGYLLSLSLGSTAALAEVHTHRSTQLAIEYAVEPGILHAHHGIRATFSPWKQRFAAGFGIDQRGYAYKYGSGPGVLVFTRAYADPLLELHPQLSLYGQVEHGISGNVFGTLNRTLYHDEYMYHTTWTGGAEWRTRHGWFLTARWGQHFGQPSKASAPGWAKTDPFDHDKLQSDGFLMPFRGTALQFGIGYDFFESAVF
ncbi:MAG: hypothetical protein OXT67_01675 [Zetaproteobacteria bacterium]|nr:hypothetical protein [Zetaproteobacteria bacterium]